MTPPVDRTRGPKSDPDAQTEQRSSGREEYPYAQRVAPMFGNRMPSREQFFEVACCDISRGGLAFHLASRPKFDQLIVALGRPPALTHYHARVVHVKEVERDGAIVYRIGCRFTCRVRV